MFQLNWVYEIMRTPVRVDGRDVIDQTAAKKARFLYKEVGKGVFFDPLENEKRA